MSFDISRKTFDAWKSYCGVVMQQGRVQMDSDWNEWMAEIARRLQAGTLDTIGAAGVPSTTPSAFKIIWDVTQTPNILTIGLGRIYVDGILAENQGSRANAQWDPALAEFSGSPQTPGASQLPINYTQQPWFPGAVSPTSTSPTAQGKYLVYLDVWQREVTYLEDPNLLEKALGTDTTGRYQTVWRVNYVDVSNVAGVACSTPDSSIVPWTNRIQPSAGRLTVGTEGTPATNPGPCALSPATGYTGLENQLYRVEIHQSGGMSSFPPTVPAPSTVATFKFSRDNGTVTTAVVAITNPTQLTVQGLGKDRVLGFHAGDWIEITDDIQELTAGAGELHRIDQIDSVSNIITLTTPLSSGFIATTQSAPNGPSPHTRVTRWDQSGKVYENDGVTVWWDLDAAGSTGDIPVPPANTTLILENGINVAFGLATSGGLFQTGDFWNFAARTADASVETLLGAPPFGIHHHYCRLAIVDFSQSPPRISDCRQLFPSLANPSIHVCKVLVGAAPLPNDGTITVQQLLDLQDPNKPLGGISIVCDQPVDPKIITQSSNQLNCPVCFVTVDVPAAVPAVVPVGSGVQTGWEGAGPGFNPLTVSAIVNVDPSDTVNWIPVSDALRALQRLPPGSPPLLARLTLKGSGIWAMGNPNVRLNGAAARPAASPLSSYDGRPYADFQMWFWLVCQPAVILPPTGIDFGDVFENTSSTAAPVTVSNYGSSPLSYTIAPGEFTLTNPTTASATPACAGSVPAATQGGPGACSITVTFTPETIGEFNGQITFSGASDGSAPSIGLQGKGVTPPQMQVTNGGMQVTTGETLNFSKNLNTGSTDNSVPPVILTSTGTSPLTILNITSNDTVNFTASPTYTEALPPSGDGTILPQGGVCTISVSFNPQVSGVLVAQLVINHNAQNVNSPLNINLSGTAVDKQIPVPEVEGFALADAQQTIKNAGLIAVTDGTLPKSGVVEVAAQNGQSPIAGTPVDPGTPVHLTIKILVPDVQSDALADAQQTITNAGLIPVIDGTPIKPPKGGVVIVAGGGQSPIAGAPVDPGTSVHLTSFTIDLPGDPPG